ncbi:MAG: hypothetical protein VR64_23470 [Desulfatitalea sp. BRH_c12]|nr:MAG: hypothetical protein VR64_23470 [Desulfatitalea sp. BRH_c12]
MDLRQGSADRKRYPQPHMIGERKQAHHQRTKKSENDKLVVSSAKEKPRIDRFCSKDIESPALLIGGRPVRYSINPGVNRDDIGLPSKIR